MFIMKSLEIRKALYFDRYHPDAFLLYIHVVDLLVCNCIYMICSSARNSASFTCKKTKVRNKHLCLD